MHPNDRHNTTPVFTVLRRIAVSQSNQPIAAERGLLKPVVAAALVGMLASPLAFAFNSGSTGADGALATTVGTMEVQVPESGVLNYTSVNIAAGTTLRFKKNRLNTPVYMLVSGNVTIAGTIDLRGEDAKHAGTYADGNQADDGIPGAGGPGGYDGGRGGRDDAAMRPEIIRGGSGLGPGGGKGGMEGADGCSAGARATTSIKGWVRPTRPRAATANTEPIAAVVSHLSGPDAAKPYGSALLQPLVGGSGGGGGRGGANFPVPAAVAVAGRCDRRFGYAQVGTHGSIDATGGDSGGGPYQRGGGNGGGGSGGAIRLIATTITAMAASTRSAVAPI